MNRFFKSLLLFSIIFFFVVTFLSFGGAIAYGHGLGDVVNDVYTLLLAVVLLIIFFIYRRKEIKTGDIGEILGTVLILFFICLDVYQFTVGRGPEYRWNGHIFLTQKSLEESDTMELQKLDTLLKKHPESDSLHYAKGSIFRGEMRNNEALAEFKSALALNPHSFDAAFECGWICERMNDSAPALLYYRMANKLDTTNTYAKHNINWLTTHYSKANKADTVK